MAAPLALVQHPLDADAPPFDFFAWRLYRRFVLAHLRALAPRDGALGPIADALEVEQMEAAHEAVLQERFAAAGRPLESLDELVLAVSERVRASRAPLPADWAPASVQPDWSAIPFVRPIFVGLIEGRRVRARLPQTTALVPEYAVLVVDDCGREFGPTPVRNGDQTLDYASGVWDWMFARRLTLLAQSGALAWPDPERLPLRLDVAFQPPARPF